MSTLESILKQYEDNNKPKYTKTEKVYDLKNYFNTFLKEGLSTGTKVIRILPMADGTTPFVEMHGHKFKLEGASKTFPCLREEKGEDCPFCEAREALLATNKESDKELAKKFKARMMYVVKVIDRDNESEGVKFWRFNHDYRKEGIYDKIIGVLNAIKKDVTHPETGRDLLITINRNQSGVPIVSAIASLDPSPLSENADNLKTWLADTRTWEDVYSVRNYEYLAVVVNGGTPIWDKEASKWVDKDSVVNVVSDGLDDELSLGVSNVKPNVTTATSSGKNTTPVLENLVDVEDDELSLGVSNVKPNVKPNVTTATSSGKNTTPVLENLVDVEDDDLPF